LAVEQDADRIEAQLLRSWRLRLLAEEGACKATDLPPFTFAERIPRRRAAQRPARFDLNEDQRCAKAHDQVDFAEAGSVVARDELVAEPLKVFQREPFTGAA
jgi:hypothetical protein